MRNKIWYKMIEAKYKAIYLTHFNSIIRAGSQLTDAWILLGATYGTSTVVSDFQIHPMGAVTVFAAPILKLLKPVIPLFKRLNDLSRAYEFYEQQYFEYEKLWMDLENDEITKRLDNRYFQLRKKELEQLQKMSAFKVPRLKWIETKTEKEWYLHLEQNY